MNISQKKYTNKIIKDNILPNSIYFLIVGEKQTLKVWCIGKCEVEDHKDMNIYVDVGHTTFYYLSIIVIGIFVKFMKLHNKTGKFYCVQITYLNIRQEEERNCLTGTIK